MANEKKSGAVRRARSRAMWFGVILLILLSAGAFFYSAYAHYTSHLRSEAELLSGTGKQTKIMLERHCQKLEDVATVMMSWDGIMSYDAADVRIDEYESAQRRGEVSDMVSRLGLLDNYCDFTLIYRNSENAGRLSQESKELLTGGGSELYQVLKDKLGDRNKVWFNGTGSTGKIFYVCRADDTKLFLGSFYISDLDSMFVKKEHLPSTGIVLGTQSGSAFYWGGTVEDGDEAGELLREALSEGGDSLRMIDYVKAKITIVEPINMGWYIVAERDLSAVQETYRRTAFVVLVLTLTAAAVTVVLHVLSLNGEGSFEDGQQGSLDTDPLTGLPRGAEAENLIADKLETCVSGSTLLIAVVCIANLGEITREKGTSAHNGALLKTSHLLAEHFGIIDDKGKNFLARTGTDEFTVLADFTEYDLFKAHDALKQSMADLTGKFAGVFLAEPGDIEIISGTAIYPDASTDYDELYDQAKNQVYEKYEESLAKKAEKTEGDEG